MGRQAFALSWGRKIFFGMGWILLSMIAMIYFQSMLVPQTFLGWVYLVSTFIGHYGLIISLLYFLLFVPFVSLFPTYYFPKIWSVFLILTANMVVFIDALIFSRYRFHLNGFFGELLLKGGVSEVLGFHTGSYALVSLVTFIVGFIIWFKGERLWRAMQARFSNPVKNWYLLAILFCLILSHGLHIYADAKGVNQITRLSVLFPVHFPTTAKGALKRQGMLSSKQKGVEDFYDFHYPRSTMKCEGQENKNILFILLDNWKYDELTPELTPALVHYTNHGTIFKNHYSASDNTKDALFSLFYSLPASYWSTVRHHVTSPVIMSESSKRHYEIGVFSSESLTNMGLDHIIFSKANSFHEFASEITTDRDLKVVESFKKWIFDLGNKDAPSPFLGVVALSSRDIKATDLLIKDMLTELYRKHLSDKTVIVLTGNHGKTLSKHSNFSREQLGVPLLVIWPDRPKQVVDEFTSHYDVVPTLMAGLWKCKNSSHDFSYGKTLFEQHQRSYHIVGSQNDIGIIDFNKNIITTLNTVGGYHVTDLSLNSVPKIKAKEETVFSSLKELTRFYKSKR